MRMATLASGSSGNCIYVGGDRGNLLIDAGISLKRAECELGKLGLTPGDIDGILITHEHVDHINGLGVLLRKYSIPVYCTEGTGKAILTTVSIGKIPEENFRWIVPGMEFELGGMRILPVAVHHDAAQPVIYRIDENNRSMAVVTDLGTYDPELIAALQDLNAVLLEANHDVHILEVGPYPYRTKQRIRSDLGHLSNEAASALLSGILNPELHHVMLGHISRTNNYEELALECVKMEVAFSEKPPKVMAAPRCGLSEVVEV